MHPDPFASYLAHLDQRLTTRGRRASPATLRAIRSDLRAFMTWWQQARPVAFSLALVLDTDLDDYLTQRQREGRAAATINRGNASLRNWFAWAVGEGLITHNPTGSLRDLPVEETAPRGLNLDGVEWLLRAAAQLGDPLERLRDTAMIVLLSDLGLRSHEAASLELRDLDLDGGALTVRMGKGRKARRILIDLDGPTMHRLRAYINTFYLAANPEIPVEPAARAAGTVLLLAARHRAKPGRPWQPGMQTVTMRKRMIALRQRAVALVRTQIEQETDTERSEALHDLIRDLETCSPHTLRHGLAYRLYAAGATTKTVARQFGHSRETTAMKYGKQKDKEIREIMGLANRRQVGEG